MKINWKVRIKNIQFWIMIFLAIAAPVSTYFNVSGADLTTWKSLWDLIIAIVKNPFVIFTILVSIYNAVIDPTTKGVSDSSQALNYDKPKGDK